MSGRSVEPRRWLAATCGLVVAVFPVAAAQAQDSPGDRVAGRQLAQQVCAECHLVEAKQLVDPMVGAPSFHEVAAEPTTTETGLRVFFRTPHEAMPDLMLSPDETDNIIAYILSLK